MRPWPYPTTTRYVYNSVTIILWKLLTEYVLEISDLIGDLTVIVCLDSRGDPTS